MCCPLGPAYHALRLDFELYWSGFRNVQCDLVPKVNIIVSVTEKSEQTLAEQYFHDNRRKGW